MFSKDGTLISASAASKCGVECEAMQKDFLTGKLELAVCIVFDRAYRLKSKPNSTVIAHRVFFKDKVKIMKTKRKLQGRQFFFIGEDFSASVREISWRVTPHVKVKSNEGCRVSMVFDHLLFDGERYSVDNGNNFTEAE